MNDFDKAARYAAKLDPPGFFRWLLTGLDTALVFHGWLDTRTLPFPGEANRTCDTVAEFASTVAPENLWAIVVEFESETEAAMPARLLDYLGRLHQERQGRYRVAAALLNLTGPVQNDTLDMRLPGMEEFGLWWRLVLRTMRDEDAAATLTGIASGQIARCILSWIPLMHGAAEPAIMSEWKRLAEADPSNLVRSQYAGLALVFADLAKCFPQWKRELEGWNVRKSQVVEEWREEGRVEGRVEAQRAALLRALTLRFRSPVPADLAAAVEALTTMQELSRWFDASLTAASLDEFRAAVLH